MPNAVKYKTGNLTGSLQKGNVALGVSGNLGPTSTTGWYNGPNPPTSGLYQIIETAASGDPDVYCPQSDAELIKFARWKGATGANTGSVAAVLAWIGTQSNLMAANFQYEGIVTDGLVLNVDAGFVGSYPTINTTWYDLSGNSNNGTLINGPTFNSSNSGSIVFDGIDDKVNLPSSNVYNFNTNDPFTLETFCYATTAASSGMIPLIERYFYGVVNFGGYGLRLRNYNTNKPLFFVTGFASVGVETIGIVEATTSWVANTWYHIVGTKNNSGTMKIYVNGTLENTITNITGAPLPSTDITLKIGARGDTDDQYSNQRFSICRIYNKELTSQEVSQNFNAQKGRFGL